MEVAINYLAVLVSGVLAMVVGFVWYGPLFGKTWMTVIGASAMDEARRKEMQKKAGPLYLLQFVMTLVQLALLDYYILALPYFPPLGIALAIWFAFIMPIVAGNAMWNNDSRKVAWTKFLLQAGYQLVIFVIFGLILGSWK